MSPLSSDKVIVCCDPGSHDLTALLFALQLDGKLEVIHCETVEPRSRREYEIQALLESMAVPKIEPLLPAPSTLPYYRRFERKRRAR